VKAIASHNGLAAATRAFEMMQGGGSPLDACVDGIELVEDDPEDLHVGYGGLPDEDGAVTLDAAVMDGPTHRGAGVACLKNVRHPTRVAQRLMEQTSRVLLAGDGALQFARANGFPEENLLTEKARKIWLAWKRLRDRRDDWQPAAEEEIDAEVRQFLREHFPEAGSTVHLSAMGAAGDLACATSTSGHAFRLPGRVGDSPILGAGLYCDNEAGACGSIGFGEANLENLSSFAAVELMANGMSPLDAGLETMRRIVRHSHCDLHSKEAPRRFNVALFLMAKDGTHAGVTLFGPRQMAVADEHGARLEDCVALLEKD